MSAGRRDQRHGERGAELQQPRRGRAPRWRSPSGSPRCASSRNCTAAPVAAPPGMTRPAALPASWEVTTANQASVRSTSRCSAQTNPNETTWQADDQHEPRRARATTPDPRTRRPRAAPGASRYIAPRARAATDPAMRSGERPVGPDEGAGAVTSASSPRRRLAPALASAAGTPLGRFGRVGRRRRRPHLTIARPADMLCVFAGRSGSRHGGR